MKITPAYVSIIGVAALFLGKRSDYLKEGDAYGEYTVIVLVIWALVTWYLHKKERD